MRTVRWMAAGLTLVALTPALGAAQTSRSFNDSWFWGVKGGVISYSTAAEHNKWAPSIGAEWLITRSRGALYISGEQAFFTGTSTVSDGTFNYNVAIKDMRRYTAALLAFPVTWGALRPYGGIGLSMNLIQHAVLSDGVDPTTAAFLQSSINDQKDAVSFLALAGLQAQYQRFSVFGQAGYMPMKNTSLFNGRTTYVLEGGIRINFGSSIESTP
jgi:hypothetical protein